MFEILGIIAFIYLALGAHTAGRKWAYHGQEMNIPVFFLFVFLWPFIDKIEE